jgi:hypothetical protein
MRDRRLVVVVVRIVVLTLVGLGLLVTVRAGNGSLFRGSGARAAAFAAPNADIPTAGVRRLTATPPWPTR